MGNRTTHHTDRNGCLTHQSMLLQPLLCNAGSGVFPRGRGRRQEVIIIWPFCSQGQLEIGIQHIQSMSVYNLDAVRISVLHSISHTNLSGCSVYHSTPQCTRVHFGILTTHLSIPQYTSVYQSTFWYTTTQQYTTVHFGILQYNSIPQYTFMYLYVLQHMFQY